MEENEDVARECSEWWTTRVTDIAPNHIAIRGYPIEELIGRVSFADMVSLMLLGELPSRDRAALLEAALVASVDHGPQAPSIATARMAATCGVPFNSIIAASASLLGDVHGGAGQQCMSFLSALLEETSQGYEASEVVGRRVAEYLANGLHIPGFGHRYHKTDPRAVRLNELLETAAAKGVVSGSYRELGSLVEDELTARKKTKMATNIDGATAIVYLELGFAPVLGRALFVLSRSVGVIANAWDEMQTGSRLKGPMPTEILPRYAGPARRTVL